MHHAAENGYKLPPSDAERDGRILNGITANIPGNAIASHSVRSVTAFARFGGTQMKCLLLALGRHRNRVVDVR